jgi:hypothetical protein
LLAISGAHSLLAQTTDPGTLAPGVIHACYVPLTGTLYRIKETNLRQACSSSTNIEFAWTDGVGALHATDETKGDLDGTFAAPVVVGLRGIGVSKDAPKKGQVLSFDGDRWSPGDLPTVNTGVVNGSFLATGTIGEGSAPATGAGARMMWDAAKGAFRAGLATGSEWDDSKIGAYSIATGTGTTASGASSAAIGTEASASASGAVALGQFTTASGANSMAMGSSTYASGSASSALGVSTTASGVGSAAMGNGSTASGDYSTAIGFASTASGDRSFAVGVQTTASGAQSIALGSNASTNDHAGSFVFGDASTFGSIAPVKAAADQQFVVRAQHMWFGRDNNVTAVTDRFLETSTHAYLGIDGIWTNAGDANDETAFQNISSDDLLARLALLKIQSWSYKADSTARHIGPSAQDFYAAFHLGHDTLTIGTADAEGVSLAAIQALVNRTTVLAAENVNLRAQLDAHNARDAELQSRLDALEAALARFTDAARNPRR